MRSSFQRAPGTRYPLSVRGLILICCAGALFGCTVDRSGTRVSARRFDSGSPFDSGVRFDGGAQVDAGAQLDAGPDGRADGGPADAGCAVGEPGEESCPFETLAAARGSTGLQYFSFGGHVFQTWVSGATAGWVLVASERGDGTGRVAMSVTTAGPLRPRSHMILGRALVLGMPDVGEVMINSTTGSEIVARVRSSDPLVLGQFRRYRSLMPPDLPAEAGSERWTADVERLDRAMAGDVVDDLPNLIYSAYENPAGLHWAPLNSNPMWHSWTAGEERRDRLNLWVRAVM